MFGIGSAVGGMFDMAGTAWQAHQQREATQRHNEWQEGQAGQRHQIAANDLRAAGFNPMLTGMNQQGAPMPSGQPSKVPDATGIGSRAVHSAQQAQQSQLTRQQREINSASVAQSKARAKVWTKYGHILAAEEAAKGKPISSAAMLKDAAPMVKKQVMSTLSQPKTTANEVRRAIESSKPINLKKMVGPDKYNFWKSQMKKGK